MNRRDFLKRAGAAAIVPAAVPGAIWGASPIAAQNAILKSLISPNLPPVAAVVFDERYADCKIFADAFVAQGAIAFPANGDSAQLWYGSLRLHLAAHPGRVAGLTTYSDFSVSRACARELNFATLYEGAHDGRRSRTHLAHHLHLVGDRREIGAVLASEDTSWAAALADALCRMPSAAPVAPLEIGAARGIATPRMFVATTRRSAGHPGYLASWLLAPRAAIS